MISKQNRKKAEQAMFDFLTALGQDMSDPNLENTPERVVKMYAEEITNGNFDKATTFDTKAGSQFLVVSDLPVASTCSHHLMPIRGVAHVGVFFIADKKGFVKLPGLSKYARIVEAYSRRLQLQERLTVQITEEIFKTFSPDFVYVVVDAEHYCMKHRGVEIDHSETMTSNMILSERFKKSKFKAEQFRADFYNQLAVRMKK